MYVSIFCRQTTTNKAKERVSLKEMVAELGEA